jgi:hypothetical protein
MLLPSLVVRTQDLSVCQNKIQHTGILHPTAKADRRSFCLYLHRECQAVSSFSRSSFLPLFHPKDFYCQLAMELFK